MVQQQNISFNQNLFLTLFRFSSPVILILLVLLVFIVHPSISPASLTPDSWVPYFQDSFESGSTEAWKLEKGWDTELEGSNFVLSGSGHYFANLDSGNFWTNYSLKIKVKLISGGIHINYRSNTVGRYFVFFHEGGVSLHKQPEWSGTVFFELANDLSPNSLNTWNDIQIIGEAGHIRVYINDVLRIDYTDSIPINYGNISFETHDDSHAHIDDVIIVGEAPPEPPARYTWIRTGGPSGGLGYDVRIHPANKNIMFVTDNPSGVNKSTDAGKTWTQKNKGISSRTGPSLDGVPNFCLTIDPNTPDIVWAGMQFARGIYKSTDGGETWVKKDNGVTEGEELSLRNFGIHPFNSNIVFAGVEITSYTLGIEFDKARGKIYRTTDGGENWECVWEGDSLARFILFDYTNPDTLYASTGIFDREAYNETGIGLLKSTDGGNSWSQINNGIENFFIGFLEMHPEDPRILFAAAGNNAHREGSGVYKTTDGGAQWKKVLDSTHSLTVVTISTANTDVVYAGGEVAFYRSMDGGSTWVKYQKEGGGYGPQGIRAGIPISAVVDPDDPMTVFVNNYNGGAFKSTDGAAAWVNSSRGYTGAHLHKIALDPINPATVYTIGRSGPYRSYDAGENWTGIAQNPANEPEWYAIAVNPSNPREVLVSSEFTGAIYKSRNAGESWTEVFRHPMVNTDDIEGRHGFKYIAYAPSDTNRVYAGMSRDRRSIDADLPAGTSYGMYKSTDGGDTWRSISTGLNGSLLNIHAIAVHPANPDTVYIGTWKDGVYKTIDGGQTWGLKSNGLVSADVRALAIDPNNPDIVYAGLGAGGGVFKSTDGGNQWNEINHGFNIVCPSALLPFGKTAKGISFDKPIKPRFSTDYYSVPWTSVWDIVIDPVNSQRVYAGDHQSGVYLSTDGGQNWVPINENLSTKAVTSLAISADGSVLYAATEGEGVFRIGNPVPVTSTTTAHASVTTTTTIVPDHGCPAETVLGADKPQLDSLRCVRDTLLSSTEEGKLLTFLYYKHAAEITSLLTRQAHLKMMAKNLFIELLPAIEQGIKDKQIKLPYNTVQKMPAFIDKLKVYATPGLARDLITIKEKLKSGVLREACGIVVLQ